MLCNIAHDERMTHAAFITVTSNAPLETRAVQTLAQCAAAVVRAASLVPPPILVVAAILLLQFGSATAKSIITPANVVAIIFLRNLFGGMALSVAARPNLGALSRGQLGTAALLGANLALMNILGYLAIAALPLGVVTTIGFLGPLGISAVMARRPSDFVWPALALAGVALLNPIQTDLDPLGLAYAFGFAASWACYILGSARSARSTPGITGLALAMAAAALFTAPLAAPALPDLLGSAENIRTIALVILFATLPFALEFSALKRMSPRQFGVLVATEPAMGALVGMVALGELLSGAAWTALALVSAAAFGSTLSAKGER